MYSSKLSSILSNIIQLPNRLSFSDCILHEYITDEAQNQGGGQCSFRLQKYNKFNVKMPSSFSHKKKEERQMLLRQSNCFSM